MLEDVWTLSTMWQYKKANKTIFILKMYSLICCIRNNKPTSFKNKKLKTPASLRLEEISVISAILEGKIACTRNVIFTLIKIGENGEEKVMLKMIKRAAGYIISKEYTRSCTSAEIESDYRSRSWLYEGSGGI